ncbi:hypothetical protein [Actinomadura roseirufa]|uniref:hypothetical protein n=1 Tax=Actinomadura roseirufa TaxID=2094049 RepID=UPI0010412442|nr:hypothetical protein [Actinomadura roseirufa]
MLHAMTNTPENGDGSDEPAEQGTPHRPMRGMIPTPKSEIDRAKPYIPDIGEKDDEEADDEEPDSPPETDGERDE